MAVYKTTLGALLLASATAAAKYEQYILAPSSRTLHPTAVYKVNGSVEGAESLVGTGDAMGRAMFQGESAVTYDFGIVCLPLPTDSALQGVNLTNRTLLGLSLSLLVTLTTINT